MQIKVPHRPWHAIGTDLFHLDEDEYLLIADYYTKYPFVWKIPKGQSTSKCVVDIIEQIFSEHGSPQIVRSDNGSHFQEHYHRCSTGCGFKHVPVLPAIQKAMDSLGARSRLLREF